MAKSAATTHMTRVERLAGTVFFLVYLLVMPLLADRLFGIFEVLLDTTIERRLRSIVYYYALFAVTLLLFHGFLARTTAKFFDDLNRALATYCIGLVLFYGANELLYRVCSVFFHSHTNLNDTTIAAALGDAPYMTTLIVVLLAPFVEEALFRGFVFGCLKEQSRVAAYLASCLLFAFLHVWTFALSSWDLSYFVLMLQYLVPGAVFAWVFDRSGTLWPSILLHATVNALALWVM